MTSTRWSAAFGRINVSMLSFAVAFAAFDARLFALRLVTNVQPDALVHYNMLLTWWRDGDSLRGFTLTPSPYFIDILLQLPIALLASDYERFSYALACCYALLLLGSVFLVLRVVLAASSTVTMIVTGAVVAGFYTSAPFNLVMHAFIVNHTSEVFSTLGLLALVHAWFRPEAHRRRYAPYVVGLLVAACVASSPFFIATYCMPATVGAVALLGTTYVHRRRLLWFVGITGIGAVIGLFSLAILSRYAWPVRGDSYQRWWKSYLAFKAAVLAEPGGVRAAIAMAVACVTSMVLVVVGRRRRWPAQVVFILAFFPAVTVACIALPIKRGAFDGVYAFRYLQLPWLMTVAFYACGAAQLVRVAVTRYVRLRQRPWLPWTSGVLGAIALALVATCHGSLTMTDERNGVSPMIGCFREVDQRGGLKDGIAMWWLGRYFTAADHAWGSDRVIVNIRDDARIDPWDNNLLWFADGFRGGKGTVNFLVTFGLGTETLELLRTRIGTPDRTISCAVPANQRLNGIPTFELWIWDRAEAQQKLTHMLLADTLRSPFSPAVGARQMEIDATWGMDSEPKASELRDGHRIWHRASAGNSDPAVSIRYMWVPSGRYHLELGVTASGPPAPLFDIQVTQARHGDLARIPVSAGTQPVAIDFDVENRGGPTSGDAIEVHVIPRSAESIDVSGATLTLVDQRGISPFQIFQ